jgi:hypothetical protein
MAAIRLKKFHGVGCGKAMNNTCEKFDSDRISLDVNYPQLTPVFAHGQPIGVFEEGVFPVLASDPITASVEKRLPALTSEIELRGAEMAKFLAGSVPLELLHSMEIVLQTYRDQLSSWNHDLTERTKILDGQIAQLDGLSKIWKSTLQLPELSKAAPEIPKRVQSLIDWTD